MTGRANRRSSEQYVYIHVCTIFTWGGKRGIFLIKGLANTEEESSRFMQATVKYGAEKLGKR